MLKLRNFLLLVVSGYAFVASAQTTDPLQYAVAPQAPGPNAQVIIEVQSVGNWLGDATVTWVKDGIVAKKGVGEGRFVFTTGTLGSETEVVVTVDSPTQGTFSRTFSFVPSTVNLVWEADTTVPPLFLGKPMYSAGSPVRVLALPVVYSGSARIAASALSFQWSLNDEPVTTQSGLGRSAISFEGDQLKTGEVVSVDLYYGARLVGQGSINIPVVDPALVLYERDPLRGLLLDNAFPAQINLLGKEITLQAQPFYFSNPDVKAGNTIYAWQLNGQDATGPDTGRGVLTLRQTGSGQGSAIVGVSLQNYSTNAFVQQAQTAIQLIFGQPAGLGNLFGL